MKDENEEALSRALSVLTAVTRQLKLGVNKKKFESDFRGKYVSPGISVMEHVKILRLSGSLQETEETMRLTPS